MNKISRENLLKLIILVREFVKKEVDLSQYLNEEYSNICFEQDEIEIDFVGVSNGFLSEVFHALAGSEVEVIGEVEELFTCPCCGFKTLTEVYDSKEGTGYDICPYCKWEDDGTVDVKSYRSINSGSMAEYRNKINANFNKYYINKWFKEEFDL